MKEMGTGSGPGREKERRFRVYEEAPGFRPGPRVMTRAQARWDRVVLSIVHFPLTTFCPPGMGSGIRDGVRDGCENGDRDDEEEGGMPGEIPNDND